MIEIRLENKDIIIRFPKELVSNDFLESFIERLEIEVLANKNQMTEEQAWQLSEEIKEDWWKKNKEEILEKVNKAGD